MTVAELMKFLSEYPPELRVVVTGYEDGYDDVESGRISVHEIRLDVNTEWYYGRHGYPEQSGPGAVVNALVLGRNNSPKGCKADP